MGKSRGKLDSGCPVTQTVLPSPSISQPSPLFQAIDWLLPCGQVERWNGKRNVNRDNSRLPSFLLNHTREPLFHHLCIKQQGRILIGLNRVMRSPHVAMKRVNMIGQAYLCARSSCHRTRSCDWQLLRTTWDGRQTVLRRRRLSVVLRKWTERTK